MYTVNKRLTVISFLFVTLVISSVDCVHQTCGQEELARCTQPLQVLTDMGLTVVKSKTDLEVICPDLLEGLRCTHNYSRRCMGYYQRLHFKKLFNGTSSMVKELCTKGSYQEEYLKYVSCMQYVVHDNELCLKKYQQTMKTFYQTFNNSVSEAETQDRGIRSVCCSFLEYVECSTHTMRKACGEEAARFGKGFIDKMSSSLIKIYCKEYMHGAGKCPYSSASQLSNSYTILKYAIKLFFNTDLY